MNHWIEVGKDIWVILQWVLPPACFWAAGGIHSEYGNDGGFVPLAMVLIGYALYALALTGAWV